MISQQQKCVCISKKTNTAMNYWQKQVKMPSWLHELFGVQARMCDLWLIISAAGVAAAAVSFLVWEEAMPAYQKIILALLALDLAGGVPANFSKGTNDYYAERPRHRMVFIALHGLQPLALVWLFPEDALPVALLSGYILLAAGLVNYLREYETQRVTAAFLLLPALLLLFVVAFSSPALRVMLALFAVKLILAFAVRW
jgi:hypothetical protein